MGQVKNLAVMLSTLIWRPYHKKSGGTKYFEKPINMDDIYHLGRAFTAEERDWMDEQVKAVRENPELFGPLSGRPYG